MEIANEDNNQEGKKWATFTYTGSETKFITKLFKNTNLKIAYKTVNTIGKLFSTHAAAVCHCLTLEALWISDSVYCHSCSVFISLLWSLQFS
jgi:hypothetical protein